MKSGGAESLAGPHLSLIICRAAQLDIRFSLGRITAIRFEGSSTTSGAVFDAPRDIYLPFAMHQYTKSSPQRATVGGQELDGIQPREDEAAMRPGNESIRSGFNVSPVLRSSLDPVSTATPSSVPDTALERFEKPASSDQTGSSIKHLPVTLLGRRPRWKRTWITPVTILGFYLICKHDKQRCTSACS